MENNDYNLELAKYIWSILKTQITIFMSWGVEPKSMKVIEKGLEFHGEKVKTIEDVFLDKLISVVDENIEKTEDYKERICREYGITEKSMSV